MKFEYDPEADGLFIWFVDIEEKKKNYSGEIWPKELNDEIGLLFDTWGKLMGLEIFPGSKYFSEDLLLKNVYAP